MLVMGISSLTNSNIMIVGAGTVGIRDADVLLSLGITLAMSKNSAYENDIKTIELKTLLKKYKDVI